MRPDRTDLNACLRIRADRRQLIGSALAIGVLAAFPRSAIAAAHGLAVQAPLPPRSVATAAGERLVHELHVSNFAGSELTVDWLEILAPDASAPLERFDGIALARMISTTGEAPAIGDGSTAVLYLDAVRERLPPAVGYRIGYRSRSDGAVLTLASQRVVHDAVRIGPPLAGGPWGAIYDPGLERGHRRMIYAVAGTPRIPGRFAVDWVALTGPGGSYDGKGGLGTPVLAVADGTVVALRDDVPDPVDPAADRDVAPADASGNFVAIDLGNGRFAFYEHLQRGLDVQLHARVRCGQTLGRLGATGQVMGAHLHFHVADRPSLLDAEGLPFLLDKGTVVGGFGSIDELAASKPWVRAPNRRDAAGLFPMPNSVIQLSEPRS